MTFKAKKFEVDEDNIFENDKLGRKKDVENFSLLLRNISAPIVLSVNAPWGTGKTAFLKMLHAHIESTGSSAIYFSAWETDFASDPLLAFLGEMNEEVSKIINGNSRKQGAWNRAKQAGSYIVNKVPTALEAVPLVGGVAREVAGDIIDMYAKNKSEIETFKANIKSLLTDKEGENQKLYIFIDELDRCRPTYAIEFLERIKHILDIEGLVFVLAMDKEQLSHSVKAIYGDEFEAVKYLKRFIDIEYTLSEPEIDAFIDHLYAIFGFQEFFQARQSYQNLKDDEENLSAVLKFLARIKKYTLRDIEQLIARINLVIHATGENIYLFPELLAFLISTKDTHNDVYQEYLNPNSTPENIIAHLYSLVKDDERLDPNVYMVWFLEAFLIAAKLDNKGHTLSNHQAIRDNTDLDNKTRLYSKKVFELVEDMNRITRGRVNLKHFVDKIELIQNFNFPEEE